MTPAFLFLLPMPFVAPSFHGAPTAPACEVQAASVESAALSKTPAPKPKKELSEQALAVLTLELKAMMRLDQLYRTPVSWGTTDPAELERLEALEDDASMAEWVRRDREGIQLPETLEKELMDKQARIDAFNLEQLVGLIETIGYPDPKRLGIDAPDPLAVLIHARTEAYDKIAPALLEEARAGRLRGRAYAALTDRKLQHRGEIQIYGMCSAIDRKTGQIQPPEIESVEATNAARALIGMPPIEEYQLIKSK